MIRRINIPVTTGSPSDNVAWWNMPKSRDAAKGYPVVVPSDAEWIALDPGVTTPNVSIAVDVPGAGLMLLVPGAVLPIPRNSRPLSMHNPVYGVTFDGTYPAAVFNGVNGVRYGRASLVCGSASSYGAWLAYANRALYPSHKAAALLTGSHALNSFSYFPTTNLKAFRVSVYPTDVNGVILGLTPGDFRVTLRRSALAPGGAPTLLAGDALDRGTVTAAYAPAAYGGATADTWQSTLGECDYVDFPVTVPQWADMIVVTALAGTGVSKVMTVIEGVPSHA